ncbi:mycothiol system anti-sigma-R factor [Nocardioides sp.]|uniref:mycothiol system anti-sigma-R factor n=1 Tax=Nocardioides sp. TaxID=35761 RepID=UPI003517B4E4
MSTAHQHGDHGVGAVGEDPSEADCADYLERIVYFLDNELDDADCAVVREHLDTCNPCLQRFDLQRTVKAVVARSCSEPAPTDLRDRVRAQIQAVQRRLAES